MVVVELREAGATGHGEGVPIARYGDTVEDCLSQIEALRPAIEAGLGRRDLIAAMKPGAARNAVDCALWDLEARLSGVAVSATLGGEPCDWATTAMTVSLDTPEAMSAAAARLAAFPIVKVKVNADDPAAQLRAARAAAPDPVFIVDANESWTMALLKEMQPVLVEVRVTLLEQPLPAANDGELAEFSPLTPICADESCHVTADLDRLDGLYQAVNIKLDKTGGLTEAMDLLAEARARGLVVMTGCMICTSLSIAAAFPIATRSDYADLDGPTWLTADREGGVRLDQGRLLRPARALWGG